MLIFLTFVLLYFLLVPRRLRWTALLLVPSLAAAAPLADPTADPIGAWGQIVATWQTHHWIAIGVGAYFVLELLVKKVPQLKKYDEGRVTIVLAGIVAVAGAGLEAYMGGGSVQAAIMAAVVAAFAYVHPEAAAVAKKQAAAA